MKLRNKIIFSRKKLKQAVSRLKKTGKKIVFTNGCYDILHTGHTKLLKKAKALGDILIVAINSDSSVRCIKGKNRPIVPQEERAEVLAALSSVDIVTVFCEPDPYNIIKDIVPDVLVKGGDWKKGTIIGADVVTGAGGKVKNIKYIKGRSTTNIIKKVLENYGNKR